jgi:hypothetical protein
MAYINPDLIQEDFDNLTGWTDNDTNGAQASISPAGQVYLDCTAMSGNGTAEQYKDLGTIGTGDFYVEIRFSGDVWDGYDTPQQGIGLSVQGTTNRLTTFIGNSYTGGDGILVFDGAAYNQALVKTWDNDWHTIIFYIHNEQTDVDIWVDKDPSTEAADVTDADCSYGAATDGAVQINGYGTVEGNGEYHIDYVYVGTTVYSATYTPLSLVLTIPSITATATYKAVISALSFVLSIPSIIARARAWEWKTKNTATYIQKTKNTATYTQKTKNSTNWSHKIRN